MPKKIKYIIMIVTPLLLVLMGYYSYVFYKNFKTQQNNKIVTTETTIEPQTNTSALFFTGNIAPINVYEVVSPIDGIATKINFSYGNRIQENQYVVSVTSDKSESDYREALAAYLKAKDSYTNSLSRFSSQEFLYKNGLIPRNDYESARSELSNNDLSYRQAMFNLKSNIDKITNSKHDRDKFFALLSHLHLGDKTVAQALNLEFGILKLYAPHAGVAMLPTKNSGTDDATVHEGSTVKPGGVLLLIGDMSGISVPISVNELNINRIKVGQKATVTGIAFPNITLNGYVASVEVQAKNDSGFGNDLPSFPVVIKVPELTAEQQKIIHIGMTAQISIDLSTPNQILVPITAVEQKSDGNYVTIIRNGKKQTVRVTAGETTLDKVTIINGLEPGDKVVDSNRTA